MEIFTQPIRFKVYYPTSGFGLKKDAEIFKKYLNLLGYPCDIEVAERNDPNSRYSTLFNFILAICRLFNLLCVLKLIRRYFRIKKNVCALHLETPFYSKFFFNEHSIFIPNQEWFNPSDVDLLRYFDDIWCKSELAFNIFTQLKYKTKFLGFCSDIDSQYQHTPKAQRYFVARSGNSRHRGIEGLVAVWNRHPEWPQLKIVIAKDRRPALSPANVEYLDIFANAAEFYQFATAAQFHVYMTEAEGFGHTIVEAMGCGAIVLVTNAPPMNEIADEHCALMVDANYSGQLSLSPRFAARPESLEKAVERAIHMQDEEIAQLSREAIIRYQHLVATFSNNLKQEIENLLHQQY